MLEQQSWNNSKMTGESFFHFGDIFWKMNWRESSLCKNQQFVHKPHQCFGLAMSQQWRNPVLLTHTNPTLPLAECSYTAQKPNLMVPCVVRTWSGSLYRSKTRTVAAAGRGRETKGWEGGRERERRGRRAERVQGEQRRNEAIALKETEADLGAPWH